MKKILAVSAIAAVVFSIVWMQRSDLRNFVVPKYNDLASLLGLTSVTLVNTSSYDERFVSVSTASDTGELDTIAYLSNRKAPLIVSLHEWSSTWQQYDPLAPYIADLGYHYVHPNHQGANRHPDACLSERVVSDIDKAIEWATMRADVDMDRILVTGMSGGAYTALGYRQKTNLQIKHTFAWAPMTDLNRWYFESRERQNKYADDMLGCIGGIYNKELLQARSPLYNEENTNGLVSMFVGINDGHEGSVPVSHAISYFNKIVSDDAVIEPKIMESLINRQNLSAKYSVHGRDVYLDRHSNGARLLIFEGGHEQLLPLALDELKSAAHQSL